MGRIDEAVQVVLDTPKTNITFLMALLHDYEHLLNDPRCARLLRDLGAEKHFETLKRVRRGEKVE